MGTPRAISEVIDSTDDSPIGDSLIGDQPDHDDGVVHLSSTRVAPSDDDVIFPALRRLATTDTSDHKIPPTHRD